MSSVPSDLNRNRFPNLFEVLSRKTVAPLDLFSFYIFMRDQQRSVDYLDFWYAVWCRLGEDASKLTRKQARCVAASAVVPVVCTAVAQVRH